MKHIELFNSQNKVGAIITYKHKGEVKKGILRWPAEKTETGRDIIWIQGYAGAIDLSAVVDNSVEVE